MNEYEDCPKHPEAKHLWMIEWKRPSVATPFIEEGFWWVWSCQHMEPPFDGAPPIRCGHMHLIKKYRGGENND